VHPNQITEWRRQLVANAADAFTNKSEHREPAIDVKALHAKIGQQALELDFSANALGRTATSPVEPRTSLQRLTWSLHLQPTPNRTKAPSDNNVYECGRMV
jgi:hypothetical protein